MGLKESGLRGSLRNVSVGIDAIPDSGGSHQWNHDEGEGTTLSDAIGGLDGAINGATWTSGAGTEDVYLDYDGTDDFTDLGSGSRSALSHFVNDGAGTILFWINPDTIASSGVNYIAGTAFTGSARSLIFAARDGDDWFFRATTSSDVVWDIQGGSADTNEWAAVAGVADGSDVFIYEAKPPDYDVTQVASATVGDTEGGDLEQNVNIGRETDNETRHWDGGIDLAFTDTSAKSQSELQTFVDDSKKFYE